MKLHNKFVPVSWPLFDENWAVFSAKISTKFLLWGTLKARLQRRFLSRQLDAIFVALKLHQVSNMFETPAISGRQIVLKIAPGLHVRFWSCNFSAAEIASSCRDKNRLYKRTLTFIINLFTYWKVKVCQKIFYFICAAIDKDRFQVS